MNKYIVILIVITLAASKRFLAKEPTNDGCWWCGLTPTQIENHVSTQAVKNV